MTTQYLRNKILVFRKTFFNFLVNCYKILPLQFPLHLALKKYLPGYTLLVELKKYNKLCVLFI